MTKVKIEVLTSTHIGSGRNLLYNYEFIPYKNNERNFLGIVDLNRVVSLIDKKNIEKMAGELAVAIERKHKVNDIIKLYAPYAEVIDYSSRSVYAEYDATKYKIYGLHEFIHDGFGYPYIPGSSIKGAIRTAILATLANGKSKYDLSLNVEEVEGEFFGRDANSSIFRFIHVGDAVFPKGETCAFLIVLLNARKNGYVLNTNIRQLVEALPPCCVAKMNLDIDVRGFNLFSVSNVEGNSLKSLSKKVNQILCGNINELFSLINSHTKNLVDEEIKIWKKKAASFRDNNIIFKYIGVLDEMNKEIENCKNGESCVLRLGFGSGWRFITGAWAERIKGASDFPKSRKIEYSYAEPLGFVKLSL